MIDIYILFGFSVIAFILFGFDRHLSHYGEGEVPAPLLFVSAALMGGFGALCGMILFHSRISDKAFKVWIPVIAVVQIALVACYRLLLNPFPIA